MEEKELLDRDESEINLSKALKKGMKKPRNKVLARLFLATFIIVSISIFVTGIMKYSERQRKKESLEETKEEYEAYVEELEYFLNAPIDREYIVKFAKEKLNLYLPDEIVYHNDTNK